jgi:hypothetical protein
MSGDCPYPPLRARCTVGEMPNETKDQAAKRESIRLTKRLTWVLWLPIACVLLCAGWLTRLFRTPKSAAELRAADKGRQSGIRRKLRGLPAVHSEGKPAA